jgi:hypothetical protein
MPLRLPSRRSLSRLRGEMAAAEISLACCLRFAFRWGPPGITALSSRKAVDCVHAAWSAPVSLIPAFHHLTVELLLTLRFVIPQDGARRETRIALCPGGQVGAEFLPLLANP